MRQVHGTRRKHISMWIRGLLDSGIHLSTVLYTLLVALSLFACGLRGRGVMVMSLARTAAGYGNAAFLACVRSAGVLGASLRPRISLSLAGSLAVAATLPWLLFASSEQSKLDRWRQVASAVPAHGDEVVVVSGSVDLMNGNKPWDWMTDPVYSNTKPKPRKRRTRAAAPAPQPAPLSFWSWFDPPPKPRRAFVAPAVQRLPPKPVVRAVRRPQAAAPVVQVSYVPAPVKRYRSLCVRTCDGYYWPISYASTRNELSDDAAACKSSCGSPAKLYFHESPDGAVEEMTDLMGAKYSETTTAFLYRTSTNPSCRCTPEPWEQASLNRHAQYAELAKAGKKIVVDKRPGKAAPAEVRRVTSVSYRTTRTATALSTLAPAASRSIIRSAPRPPRQAGQPRRKVRRATAELPGGFSSALGFNPPAAAPVARRRTPQATRPARPVGYGGFNELPKWQR